MRPSYVILAVLIAVAAGCQENKRPTMQQTATNQWNVARANVLQSLTNDQYKNGDFVKARQSVTEALRLDPENPLLHILSAKLAIEEGQLERADKELAEARRLAPKNAEADYLSGVVYQRWQKPQIAADYYRAAFEKSPAELAYLLAQAEMMVAMDRPAEAMAMLRDKVTYFEHSAVIRDEVGQLLVLEGHYAQAVEILRQATILASEDLTIREHLAMAMYYNKQYRDAADVLGRLLKSASYDQRGDLWVVLGECQLAMERPREARISFETATQVDPNNSSTWLRLGRAALRSDERQRAELAIRKAAWLDPGNADAHLMLGYVHLKCHALNEALAEFTKAHALAADDTVSLCMIGYVKERLGRSDEAIECYARALKIKPNDELARTLMASAGVNK